MKLILYPKQLFNVFIFLISIVCLSTVSAANNKLESYTFIGQFKPEIAQLTLQKIPPLNTLEIKHTVNLYKIRYQTPAPDGSTTIASGLVAMPANPTHKVAIVSYFHGTRITRDDVPSRNDEKNYIYPGVFSSSGGYMLVMPDYLGLGDNPLTMHPYVQANTLASTSIDMIIAAKELAAELNYPVNDKLYLGGYSEGGFTTTVTYEALLKNYKSMPVTAVAPGSAPYDWNETMHFILLQPGPRATVYLAYFFYSLQNYYHYWQGLDVIFRKPYDRLIPSLYDGTHQLPELLAALPEDPQQILQPAFLAAVLNGTDPNTQQLINNFNHYTFTSSSPLLLVGTKGDHDVPYHGAEIAYQFLKQHSNSVYIKSVSDVLDHLQAFPVVMKEQLAFFKQQD